MALDTELLGSCGLLFVAEVFSSEQYSLSRVSHNGRELIAEISEGTGYRHRWPSVRGLILPISARDLPGGRKLLLFDPGQGVSLAETLRTEGTPGIPGAIAYTLKVLRIVTDLQSAGMISGYLGPEMFLLRQGELFLLAGRRGVPSTSFTPPEAIDTRPSDPRSDVWAIATLLFRIIAASDDKDRQMDVWSKLPDRVRDAIKQMVSPAPEHRPSGLAAVSGILNSLCSEEPACKEAPAPDAANGFKKPTGPVAKKRKKGSSGIPGRKLLRVAVVLAVAVAAYLVYNSSGLSGDEVSPQPVAFLRDSVPETVPESEASPWADTIHVPPLGGTAFEDTARVWISNCTGVPGVENQFRAGPASQYSHVYPLAGTTGRRTSAILVRRTDPHLPVASTDAGRAAAVMADTGYAVKAVDLTILLGTDLRYAGINPQFLTTPSSPAGTLFVDVVNHGIQYPLEGLGAATWAAGRLDGRSCRINDTEWLVKVSDIRDADRYNDEIGIPSLLQETLFLRHSSNAQAETLEILIRQYFQALPLQGSFMLDQVPIPHIHVLMGTDD
jgi:hypothetical protein